MALEIENNLVAAVAGGGPIPVVAAQFGISDLSHPGLGEWEFTALEALGPAEYATTCVVDGAVPGIINVVQLDPNRWGVYVSDVAGVAGIDVAWHVKIFRIATGV